MRQSSRPRGSLPARFVVLALGAGVLTAPLQAQELYRVVRTENFRRAASATAPILAQVSPGSQVQAVPSQIEWLQVQLEGWIWSASVRSTTRDGYDLEVMEEGGENLRGTPNGAILARLSQGALLEEIDRQANWIQVRRSGWMWAASLERLGEQATRSAGAAAPPIEADSGARLDRAVLSNAAPMVRVLQGDESATLAEGTPVKILARSGEWVRVQLEGWVRESDLRPAADGVLEGVTGAEVRASPEEYEGKLLQWNVQFLAIQEADELRSEIPLGRRYMLARGPLPEAGFVYVILPPDRIAEVERLAPIAQVVIIGRLRVARSRYLGNPVVELVDLAVRQP
ncbi:MAG: hypothetical protein AMS18_05005 [Gemmatimonas sp. SG8_17]|nr:MAG: hypothetical protein AMS18_05005 [Gemmatimonas sp. SG8_17]